MDTSRTRSTTHDCPHTKHRRLRHPYRRQRKPGRPRVDRPDRHRDPLLVQRDPGRLRPRHARRGHPLPARHQAPRLHPSSATLLATMSLVGVGIGASLVGPISDRLGRRWAVVGSVVIFSVFTLLQPLATSVGMFTILRFVAGMGLGAVQPVALTIMSEVTPPKHKAKATTVTMTGYHLGAVIASLFALAAGHDWQLLFYVGGGLGLVLAVVQFFLLPDSRPQHAAGEKLPLSALLGRTYRRTSIASWVGAFMGLLLVYGLLTWLPQIMKSAGYSLDSSLVMLFVMNVGAVVGLLLAGWIADTKGIKKSALVWFALGAVFLALLSVRFTNTLALNGVVFVTGVFIFSAMTLIYALVAHLYPSQIRGTAMGLTSGIGRLGSIAGPMVTGALVANGLGHPWGFWFFAVVAVIGLLAVLVVPAEPPVPFASATDPGRPYPVDEQHPEAF
ncbi:MFS transporter [Raineyella fluvialis]|uniref:MFS transporter n=1 Tax=Raineyella fluvialis TaxID=2662261 RepID=UPI001E33B028|nr:aromatic acid/H+ symport family MFS transporter [Raineyella fluvialis]